MGEMETPKASAKQEHGTGKDRLDFSTRGCGGMTSNLSGRVWSRMWEEIEGIRLATAVERSETREYLTEIHET